MNGVAPWPPTDKPTTFVVGAADWPGVEWPMQIMTDGKPDNDTWTGEGEWGEFWLGSGGTCVDREPPVGRLSPPTTLWGLWHRACRGTH